MAVKSFTFFDDYFDLICVVQQQKERDKLSFAILNYMFKDVLPDLNENQMAIFRNLKRPLDKSKNKSNNKIKMKSNENQIETKTKPNENQIENTSKMSMSMSMSMLYVIKKIIDYLNNKTNSKFKYNTKSTQRKINARLNEGYKLDDFIVVIDKKSKDWLGTEFEKYLCPETLFGTKFEKYLNQKDFKDVELSEEDKELLDFVEDEFKRKLSNSETDNLKRWRNVYKNEIIKYAVERASLSNVKTISYVDGILKKWVSKGWYDLEEIKEDTEKWGS